MATLLKSRAGLADDGRDQTIDIGRAFALDSGDVLQDTQLNVRRYGSADAPLVVVMGGISADRQLCGAGGWWSDIVGKGAAIDCDRYSVLGIDFAPGEDRRVRISPADQARLVLAGFDALAVERAHAFVGASYGGMVGLALGALAPQRLGRLCVISAAHEPAPLGSAWRGVQRRIVELARANNTGAEGLALARQLAMITYRSAEEFQSRFDRRLDESHTSDLDRYLIARGQAFTDRMGADRWLSLSEAIDRTHVDPLAVLAPTTLVACSSDQLVPLTQMEDLSRRLPKLTAFHVIRSIYGHDAFLKEPTQISRILRRFLDESRA